MLRVYRVSHSFVAASSRRQARRRIRRVPSVRVSAAMDRNPLTNTRVGYKRDEMWSESLVGTVKQHDCHAFLVHGTGETWPGKEFETRPGSSDEKQEDASPAIVMHEALLHASGTYKGGIHRFAKNAVGNVKLNLAEALFAAGGVSGDRPGDVLLFPQMQRHRLGGESVGNKNEVAKFVKRVIVDGDVGKDVSTIGNKAHVFICTHGARDARCGVCGPALVDAFRVAVAKDAHLKNKVEVRGCSHVGGHAYAGNVLVFAPANGIGDAPKKEGSKESSETKGTWYGYVTPSQIDEVLQKTVLKGEVVPRLWRGSMGMDPNEHAAAAASAAAADGEPWPAKSPCDVCAETPTGVGDIEDAAGVVSTSVKKTETTSTKPAKPATKTGDKTETEPAARNSKALEAAFATTAVAGAIGLVGSMVWAYLEQ
jgi:(2Fe-2S) ferredoxin